MSRKPVLISKFPEEAIKDAFKQFTARIVSTSKLSYSSTEDDDEESDERLCTCRCKKSNKTNADKEINDQHIHMKDKNTSKKGLNSDENDMNTFINNNNINTQSNNNEQYTDEDSNHCSDCQCVNCQTINKCNENTNKLITDEERKKKKSEKKKAQKKKKRDRKKAEKLTNQLQNVDIETSEINNEEGANNSGKDGRTDNNKSKKENKKKNASNDNNKQNTKKSNDSKEVEKTVAKPLASGSSRESEKMSSNKSSPKSERENDVSVDDIEEEELSFSSAYVSQIAQRQRKSKPPKSAQLHSEAQDYSHSNEDNLKNSSNYINSNSSSSSSSSNFNNNTVINTNKPVKEVNEELPKTKIIGEQKQKPLKVPKENKLQNIDKSIELAILANQKAEALKFNEAIDLFSQALAYNPSDYRFYVNRSYCYDSIQDYRSALRDAEIAIQIRSDWPKCHYRKGKALAGLKNYQEAEIALKKVISIEKDCDEALTELWHVRYGAIVDMGYDASTANIYASQYDTIKDALDTLSAKSNNNLKSSNISNKSSISYNNSQTLKKPLNNSWDSPANALNAKDNEIWEDDDIYHSDDEYNADKDASFEETSPTNPFGWKALWVGNVSYNARLDTVTTMFRKFGNLNYCNIFKGNNGGNFILVHYDNPESPRLAMSKYQRKVVPGVSISDTPLMIRFRPNKDQKKPNYDQRLESDECYYWRTTGCARGDKCLYKHIYANKGVDKQAWMNNPLRKGLPFNNGKSLK